MTRYVTESERPLSPSELAIWSADTMCSMNFSMHFELRGALTDQHLRTALERVQRRHPLLAMRISEEGTDVWFRRDGVTAIPVRLVDGPTGQLTAEAEAEVRVALDWRHGPLIRCVWLRHDPTHATILLTFSHVIGDGISGYYLVQDLLKALANEQIPRLPLAESLDGHLPERARGVRGVVGFLQTVGRTIGWTLRRGRSRTIPREHAASFANRRAILVLTRFEPTFTEALSARARAEKTTVHGALSAAIVLAGLPEIGTPKTHIIFYSPLNMRDRFDPPIGEDIGFYVAVGMSSHVVRTGHDFWSLARELKQGLQSAVDLDMPFHGLTGLAPGLARLRRLVGGGQRGRQAVALGVASGMAPELFALTNIGRVKLAANYGGFKVASLGFVASASVMGSNGFTAAALDNILYLNSVAMEPLVSRETQQRVVERVGTILHAAIALPDRN